ncbi:hypothetical protein KR044_006564 [Drosophila immigrans]|nr:hypothetical protein KR044_006564 [Drosophila immigrans]
MNRKAQQVNANAIKRPTNAASNDADDDDNIQNLLLNIRQRQSRRNRTPAQERLESLQLKLKNGRITKDQHTPKRTTRNSTGISVERLHNMTASSTALKSFSFASNAAAGACSPATAPSSSHSRRALHANPFAKPSRSSNSGGVLNAWAKPKALIDASNRLHNNRPAISANSRLALLEASLQQEHRDNSNDNNNNNVLPTNTITNLSNDEPMEIEAMDIDAEVADVAAADDETPVDLSVPKPDDEVTNKADRVLPKRMVDHMYYVLDTNILMDNLSFVDDLCRLALGDSKGSMLFIPYVVIKELDRIKDRSSDAHKRTAAIRAIHYLNDKFDKSLRIQGQSAQEDAEHLIEVVCGDDSIVNCCVQLSSQVPKLTLLTNDANLRLKAKTSSITVASRSDLLSRNHKDFDTLQS